MSPALLTPYRALTGVTAAAAVAPKVVARGAAWVVPTALADASGVSAATAAVVVPTRAAVMAATVIRDRMPVRFRPEELAT